MNDLLHLESEGQRVAIHPCGAHVVSWISSDGRERLFVSSTTGSGVGTAIRGGIPVIFPQFSDYGPYPRHGLARTRLWELAWLEADQAVFHFTDTEETRALWPHAFHCALKVQLSVDALQVELQVHNPGPEAFAFTAALHSYLAVQALDATQVHGLSGHSFLDHNDRSHTQVDSDASLTFPGEIDRAYHDVAGPLRLSDGDRAMLVEATGFPDAVVWNPGPEKGAALKDLEPDGFRRFVCIESGAVRVPILLPAGDRWKGQQRLSVAG